MIPQLRHITNQRLYEESKRLLVDQLIGLALAGGLAWEREDDRTLITTADLGLPGQESITMKVLFHRQYDDFGDRCYYLQIGDKAGPCRNSADANVAILAERLFG